MPPRHRFVQPRRTWIEQRCFQPGWNLTWEGLRDPRRALSNTPWEGHVEVCQAPPQAASFEIHWPQMRRAPLFLQISQRRQDHVRNGRRELGHGDFYQKFPRGVMREILSSLIFPAFCSFLFTYIQMFILGYLTFLKQHKYFKELIGTFDRSLHETKYKWRFKKKFSIRNMKKTSYKNLIIFLSATLELVVATYYVRMNSHAAFEL